MKILYDARIQMRFSTGGISRYCTELLRGLAMLPDYRLLVACPPGAPGFPVSDKSIQQFTLRTPWLDRMRIRLFKPQLFQTSYYDGDSWPGLPRITTVYDFIDCRFPALQPNRCGFIEEQRKCIEGSRAVIAISESTRLDTLRFTDIAEEKVFVAYPAVAQHFQSSIPTQDEQAQVRQKITGGQPYWLWVGPRRGYKNFSTLLDAFCKIARETDMHLTLVGGGERRLSEFEERQVLQARVEDRIHFLPRISDQDLRMVYASALALVQSSYWEGFGIPLVEALSCGTGLVVSDIPVFREIAGEFAIYADPFDGSAWIQALEQSLTMPDTESIQKCRHRLAAKFTGAACTKAVDNAYRNILQQ
jgi:glycosyltransferase involved in cell wall biosynthesis